nr:zinc finger protein 184-like [Misgurnus anguillicaudatus]
MSRDQSRTPQTLLDSKLSEEKSRHTQDSDLSLTLLCYTESKHTDIQDTTVCDSKQSLQEDQTSTESLDSVCNAGEQQQILQTKLKMCSVKLIDCTNLMMKIKTEPTEIKTEPTEIKTEPTEIKTEPTEIKTEPTEEEDRPDEDDDFITSDVKCDSCLDIEITSSTSKERLTAQTLSCITCGKTFSSQRLLERHERKHTEQKLFTRSEISFTTLQEKKLHSKDHREKKKQFHCEQCGKICVSSYKLNIHMMIHSDEKPFNCTECGKYFRTKQYLQVHQRIHTGEKPYKCPHCGDSFSVKHTLLRHQRLHTGEKPFKCSQCGKTFACSSNLKNHERVHTGEKHYHCSAGVGNWRPAGQKWPASNIFWPAGLI